LPAAFRPTAKIFPRLGCLGIAPPVKLLRRVVISVTDALAVACVMLPLTLTALANFLAKVVAVDSAIKIGVSVDVDVDIPAAPVGAAPRVSPRSAERNACPKGKHGCAKGVPGWIPRVGRISRRPRSVNHGRIVGRDIHNLRTRRFNLDDLFLDDDFLLLCRLQITGGLSLGAEPLNCIHDLFLL
jgi:hypothetical protein